MCMSFQQCLYTVHTCDTGKIRLSLFSHLCSWENRQQYVDCIRSLRMKELRCAERMHILKTGMASVLPLQILPVLSAMDMELRTCGQPEVDLDFLKVSCSVFNCFMEESYLKNL